MERHESYKTKIIFNTKIFNFVFIQIKQRPVSIIKKDTIKEAANKSKKFL